VSAKQVRSFSRFAGVCGELCGRQFLHELVQNDAAQATAFDRHWGVERRVFGGIRRLRRQDFPDRGTWGLASMMGMPRFM